MFPFEYWAATKPSSRASVQAQAFSSQELNQKGTMAWMWSQLLCVTVQVALWTSIVQTHHHHLSLLLHHLIKLLPRRCTFKSVMASQISSTMNSPCYIPLSRWLFFVNVNQRWTVHALCRSKQSRKSLSQDIDLEQLPSPYHGAYYPFKACLAAVLVDEVLYMYIN